MSKRKVPQSTIYILDEQIKVLSSTWRYTGPYCSMQPEKGNDVLYINFDLGIDADHFEQIC